MTWRVAEFVRTSRVAEFVRTLESFAMFRVSRILTNPATAIHLDSGREKSNGSDAARPGPGPLNTHHFAPTGFAPAFFMRTLYNDVLAVMNRVL